MERLEATQTPRPLTHRRFRSATNICVGEWTLAWYQPIRYRHPPILGVLLAHRLSVCIELEPGTTVVGRLAWDSVCVKVELMAFSPEIGATCLLVG
jgi:hypothetical protein